MEGCPDAENDHHQDLQYRQACHDGPEKRAEDQHADVLVHRPCGKSHRRVLHPAYRWTPVVIRPLGGQHRRDDLKG